jgi:hypothetical protein
VALHYFDCGVCALNGFTVIRRDVIRSRKFIPAADMVARISIAKHTRPMCPKGLDFTSWRSLLESAAKEFPLITIYRERIRRGKRYIGKPLKFTQQALWLHTVCPEAEWDEVLRLQYRDITRLDFGGEYERWLYRFAGPRKYEGVPR